MISKRSRSFVLLDLKYNQTTMKNLILFTLLFIALPALQSQDIIVTNDNDFLDVEIISMESTKTFYKLKGQETISVMENSEIKAFKWASKEVQQQEKKSTLVAADLSKSGFELQKKPNDASKTLGYASLAGIGGSILLMNSANDDNFGDGLAKGFFSVIIFTGSIVTGVVALALKGRGDSYEIKPSSDQVLLMYSPEVMRLKQKELAKNAHLSVSNTGLGLQLNF